MFLTVFNAQFDFQRFFLFYYSNLNYIVVLSTFNLFLLSVRFRFAALNECFNQVILPKSKFGIITTTSFIQNSTEIISKFGKLYEHMNDAIDMVNLCFSFQIMLGLGLFFVYTIFTIFATYRILIDYDQNLFYILLSNIFWNILYFINVVAILALGSLISNDVSLKTLEI